MKCPRCNSRKVSGDENRAGQMALYGCDSVGRFSDLPRLDFQSSECKRRERKALEGALDHALQRATSAEDALGRVRKHWPLVRSSAVMDIQGLARSSDETVAGMLHVYGIDAALDAAPETADKLPDLAGED